MKHNIEFKFMNKKIFSKIKIFMREGGGEE